MKIIEVPVYNEDGTVKFTASLSPEQTQHLLEFALNMQIAIGMQTQIAVANGTMDNDVQDNQEFDD